MRITVRRFANDRDTTLSTIAVNGRFVCFGLEDEPRDEKVAGETRIPAGKYRVGLRRHGRFHTRYAAKFSSIHRGMLEVREVPGFTDILIHVGNTDEDTAGCLLVGMGTWARLGDMSVTASIEAYRLVYGHVVAAAELGDVTIEFIDAD